MTILARCKRQLDAALATLTLPPRTKLEVSFADGRLELSRLELDGDGEAQDVRQGSFSRGVETELPVREERVALWAKALLTMSLDDGPMLSQGAPGLLFRPELDTEAAMLAAMRDPDYALFAEQTLEASGPDEGQIVAAVQSGNWLWVGDLLAKNAALADVESDGSPLIELAEESSEPGAARCLELLRAAAPPPD